MKIINNTIALLIAILAISSCQKEITGEIHSPGDSTAVSTSLRPKKYIEDYTTSTGTHSSTTYNLSYDAMGRITSFVDSAFAGNKIIYQYTGNSYTMDIYDSNKVSIHETFFLNNLSLVDSSLQYNDQKDTSSEKYLYNSTKQLITLKEYNFSSGAALYNTHTYSYDSLGNQTKDADNFSVTNYDYYTNYTNNLSLGEPYFFTNKNLVKTTNYTSSSFSYTSNHSYLFDIQNRQSSEKEAANNGDVLIRKYIY